MTCCKVCDMNMYWRVQFGQYWGIESIKVAGELLLCPIIIIAIGIPNDPRKSNAARENRPNIRADLNSVKSEVPRFVYLGPCLGISSIGPRQLAKSGISFFPQQDQPIVQISGT